VSTNKLEAIGVLKRKGKSGELTDPFLLLPYSIGSEGEYAFCTQDDDGYIEMQRREGIVKSSVSISITNRDLR